MRRPVLVASMVALVLVGALSVLLATRHPVSDATSADSPLVGRPAPPLVGPYLGRSGTFDLAAQRGRIVVVNFWASWCVPCQLEAANLSTVAWAERHRGVELVGVVFNDTVAAALAFAHHYGSLYPSIVDRGGVLANRYGVVSPPTTFVVGPTGRVVAYLVGPLGTAQLEGVLARVRAQGS